MLRVPLTRQFRSQFPAATRARGRSYLERGLVLELQEHDGFLTALVAGGEVYEVLIHTDDAIDVWTCTCEAFRQFGPCKHMWAVLLAAESLDPEVSEFLDGWTDLDVDREPAPPRHASGAPSWKERLERLRRARPLHARDPWSEVSGPGTRLEYVLELTRSLHAGEIEIRTQRRKRRANGEWGQARDVQPDRLELESLEPEDRDLLRRIGFDGRSPFLTGRFYLSYDATITLTEEQARDVLPRIAATGRMRIGEGREDREDGEWIAWDAGEPWTFGLTLTREEHEIVVEGHLARDGEKLPAGEVRAVLPGDLLLARDTLLRFDSRGARSWLVDLVDRGAIRLPHEAAAELRASLLHLPVELLEGDELLPTPEAAVPRPHLYVEPVPERTRQGGRVRCHVSFDYGGKERVDPEHPDLLLEAADGEHVLRRDLDAEKEHLAAYLAAGGRRTAADRRDGTHGTVAAGRVPAIVRTLLVAGWTVEAEGQRYRRPGSTRASVSSGLDWFELEGGLEFDDQVAPFPELLRAVRAGRREVRLGDGSVGLLPEDWLKSWGMIEFADGEDGDALRFRPHQGWLLDALLAEREGVETDAGFERYRERLAGFRGVRARKEPRGFRGELRPYQREGLGWFRFLNELGLGGCLADDMGLGKTVQVLALLESRRVQARKAPGGPRASLVVAPRSLVFNWIDEAARFAPSLKVLDYTGTDRAARRADEGPFDLLLTTYGTLRRDAPELAKETFDYVVLDEATAIKNASSQAAKAARLLRAEHRLALSGTPVENHMGELWSLFEFLNPGMLGRSSVFKRLCAADGSRGGLAALARALRPFFLRRTKDEVLDDLPEKSEQLVLCELSRRERKRYDELRDHYRAALLAGTAGGDADDPDADLGRMKIQVLEALLRLRQSACHPGLIDPARNAEDSAKLDALLPRLEELADEGHKVLVFSQFTRLLAIVRDRLDAAGITYEYLDGRTRKRKERVDRFQSDPDCPVFLISLKAGGHGLNLTASDYVFLLDPWWNPAVESQAIDRAHRLGQTRPVFAYRLIAKDTVEQRVLELQERKRELAAALLGEGTGVLKDLTRADLEALLS